VSVYVRFSCDFCHEQLDGTANELEHVVDLVCDLGAGWEVVDIEGWPWVACPECVQKGDPPRAAAKPAKTPRSGD
jgi:hypothetical protein